MLDRETTWRFLYTLAWSFEALQWETKELGWRPEELSWPKKIRRGEGVRISGDCRILQDRFALVFQDFFRGLQRDEYWKIHDEMKGLVFSNWRDWSQNLR